MPPEPLRSDLRIVPTAWDHPDARELRAAANRFYLTIYGEPDETPLHADEFVAPAGRFLVGYLDNEPVGSAGWRFSAASMVGARRPAEIKRMFVVEAVRGRGLARALMRAIEDEARAAGADWMILETGRPQVAAVALYRACGYTDLPAFGHYAKAPEVVNLGKPLGG